ncbi:ribosomal maturation YjgA family protein [Duganella sp. S19_KUP01_CR8]|uniref:ribosomal maturation YjgA family protein n=1 Tax=Duganella sp. S19_KUP01_CR8 TaxID=3025502 RepID=UPI002FCD740D
MAKKRYWLFIGWVAVIIVGLLSRKYPFLLPAFLGKYPGDALWAMMVYLACSFIRPAAATGRLAASALAISYLDELSQLYQAPWINTIRATTAGHLVLGSAFSWYDMLAYTIGIVLVAVVMERVKGIEPSS